MRGRKVQTLLTLLPLAALGACAAYVPPAPAPPERLSRDLPASYDRAWSAATRVADADIFTTSANKASGVLTLGFETRDPTPYIDCGGTADAATGATTPTLLALGFDSAYLQGTATIDVRPEGADAAAVRVSDRYTLDVYRLDPIGNRIRIAEWRFGGAASDTQRVGLRRITCRSSHDVARRLLDEVAARL